MKVEFCESFETVVGDWNAAGYYWQLRESYGLLETGTAEVRQLPFKDGELLHYEARISTYKRNKG